MHAEASRPHVKPSWLSLLLLATSVHLAPAAEVATSVRIVVLDANDRQPLACRVYVRGPSDKFLEGVIRSLDPQGSAVVYSKVKRGATEIHTTVSAHPFAVDLPPGKYTILVERGKEYRPLAQDLTVGDAPITVEIPLRRWVDMADRGWYSGDTHVHRPLEELPNLMQAEDLNVAFPLTYWVHEANVLPEQGKDTRIPARPNLIEVDKTHVIYPLNTEYEIATVGGAKHLLGAFFVINQKNVLRKGVPPVGPIAEQAHREGALIELDKHVWPWTMMLVPVMQADLYELANNHIWRTGFTFKKFEQEPPDYMQIERDAEGWTEWGWIDFGFQNYYALLNCGFRLKPTAGNASGVHPVPLGFGRVYVHLPEGFSYKTWMKALANGRSFVTTGPMLFCKVNGELPGHTFQQAQTDPGNYEVSGSILSEQPLDRIELIVNGEIARTIRPTNQKDSSDAFINAVNEKLTIESTSWIAVRAFEYVADKRVRFAHSSPVFVDVEGRPLRPRKAEIEYLIKRVQDQIARNVSVLTKESLDEYQDALRSYQSILNPQQ